MVQSSVKTAGSAKVRSHGASQKSCGKHSCDASARKSANGHEAPHKKADRAEIQHGKRESHHDKVRDRHAGPYKPSKGAGAKGRPTSLGKSNKRAEGFKHYQRLAKEHSKKATVEKVVVPEPEEEVVAPTENPLSAAPPELQVTIGGLTWLG